MKRYPIEPLRELRKNSVEQRKLTLAARLKEEAKAAGEERNATERVELSRRRFDQRRCDEIDRASEGVARAGDFQQFASYRVAEAQRQAALEDQKRAAAEAAERAAASKQRAQVELVDAQAQAKVIEHHHDKFEAEARAEAERRQEEEALEVWGARRDR